jgi:hypothetical protein
MQVQLLVERDQNECIVKLAGTAYKFKRNEYGHLVSDITDHDDIKWVSDPMHSTSFKVYSKPKMAADSPSIPFCMDGLAVELPPVVEDELPVHEQVGSKAYAPHFGQVDESEPIPYPKKGSKRPKKRAN